jgi:hypothetical protein
VCSDARPTRSAQWKLSSAPFAPFSVVIYYQESGSMNQRFSAGAREPGRAPSLRATPTSEEMRIAAGGGKIGAKGPCESWARPASADVRIKSAGGRFDAAQGLVEIERSVRQSWRGRIPAIESRPAASIVGGPFSRTPVRSPPRLGVASRSKAPRGQPIEQHVDADQA